VSREVSVERTRVYRARYEEEGDCPTREIIRYAAALTRKGVAEFFEFECEILSFCGVLMEPRVYL
jgi:hypothetical protein